MNPEDRKDLICRMEHIIGNSCYNGNIQNYGPGGVWEGEGREFRYPKNFIDENCEKIKCRTVDSNMNTQTFLSGYYAFGANSLDIMRALDSIVSVIEKEYSIEKKKVVR